MAPCVAARIASCIQDLTCWNRGGSKLVSGICRIGTCNGDGVTPCSRDASCEGRPDESGDRADGDEDDDDTGGQCIRTPSHCLEQPLVNNSLGLDFHPAGRAGSAGACREARRNDCTIFSCGEPSGSHSGAWAATRFALPSNSVRGGLGRPLVSSSLDRDASGTGLAGEEQREGTSIGAGIAGPAGSEREGESGAREEV